jgi:hypothetical protein
MSRTRAGERDDRGNRNRGGTGDGETGDYRENGDSGGNGSDGRDAGGAGQRELQGMAVRPNVNQVRDEPLPASHDADKDQQANKDQ